MRKIIETRQFKKDLKKIASSGRYKKSDLMDLLQDLIEDKPLNPSYQDHHLQGNWKSFRECHIKPDWLLIYKKYDDILLLARTGSHSTLF